MRTASCSRAITNTSPIARRRNATSAAAIGAALTKLELAGRFLSEVFWQRLYDQVEKQPDPPYMPHAVMPRAFKAAESQWARPDWLQQSLKRYAADDDTHPSLAERLAALDLEACDARRTMPITPRCRCFIPRRRRW